MQNDRQYHPGALQFVFAACFFVTVLGCVSVDRDRTQAVVSQSYTEDAIRYQQYVDTLAADDMQGRGVGYEGLIKARDYIVEDLRTSGVRAGFKKSNQELGSYLQPFEIRMPVDLQEKYLAICHKNDTAIVTEEFDKQSYNVLGMSASQSFAGKKIVFAGYGIVAPEYDYDSYAGLDEKDINDAVVVIFRYEPTEERRSRWAKNLKIRVPWTDHASMQSKVKVAEGKGAAAVVIVNPPSFALTSLQTTAGSVATDEPPQVPVYHARTTFLSRLYELNGMNPNRLNADERRANHGKFEAVTFGEITLEGKAMVTRKSGAVDNVAGVVHGVGALKDEVIVVGAHYDHIGYGEIASRSGIHAIHNGADDNASGTAMVMMLSKRYQAFANDHPDQSRRTVVFAFFSAEERGLFGSRYMTKHLDDLNLPEGARIVSMLNYDMVGRMTDDTIYIYETPTSQDWVSVIEDANEKVGMTVKMPAQSIGASDHMLFIYKRIPSLLFFSGMHDDYHSVTDTSEKINAEGASRLFALSSELIVKLATNEKAVAFSERYTREREGRSRELTYRADITALRRTPATTAELAEGGYVLRRDPRGLLAELKLLQGDKLIRWNDKTIRSVRDIEQYLKMMRDGDSVTLIAQRGNERLRLVFTVMKK